MRSCGYCTRYSCFPEFFVCAQNIPRKAENPNLTTCKWQDSLFNDLAEAKHGIKNANAQKENHILGRSLCSMCICAQITFQLLSALAVAAQRTQNEPSNHRFHSCLLRSNEDKCCLHPVVWHCGTSVANSIYYIIYATGQRRLQLFF